MAKTTEVKAMNAESVNVFFMLMMTEMASVRVSQ